MDEIQRRRVGRAAAVWGAGRRDFVTRAATGCRAARWYGGCFGGREAAQARDTAGVVTAGWWQGSGRPPSRGRMAGARAGGSGATAYRRGCRKDPRKLRDANSLGRGRRRGGPRALARGQGRQKRKKPPARPRSGHRRSIASTRRARRDQSQTTRGSLGRGVARITMVEHGESAVAIAEIRGEREPAARLVAHAAEGGRCRPAPRLVAERSGRARGRRRAGAGRAERWLSRKRARRPLPSPVITLPRLPIWARGPPAHFLGAAEETIAAWVSPRSSAARPAVIKR